MRGAHRDGVELVRLLLKRGAELFVRGVDLPDARMHVLQRIRRALHRALYAAHLRGDVLGRLRGLGGERLHLAGDHGEALARRAGTGRLDTGVQGQQRGLARDGLDETDDLLDPRRGAGEPAHGLVGAREVGGGACACLPRRADVSGGLLDGQKDAAGGDGDGRHVVRRGPGGVGGIGHLAMHVAVAFLEVGGGLADPGAAVGEGLDHVVDGAAEAAGEEAAARHVQPRLRFAPPLIDGERVGFEHRGAQGIDASGDGGKGTGLLTRQDGLAVAMGDAVRHGGERLERRLDDHDGGERRAEPGQNAGDHAERRGGEHRKTGGHEQWNGDGGARQPGFANRCHANPPDPRSTLRAKPCDYLSDSIEFSAYSKSRRAQRLGYATPDASPLAPYVFIESKNSALFLVCFSLSLRNSMASMVPMGLRMRRSTYIFLS